MIDLSNDKKELIYRHVQKDLNPSNLDVIWRLVVAISVGGIFSMLFCGQFGVGFSEMAKGWNHMIHVYMGAIQCVIICGTIFSVAPVFVLRLISSGILFRKIIRSYGLIHGSVIALAGVIMYFGGSIMNELVNISVWSLSAYLAFKLIALLVDEISRLSVSFDKL